MLCKKQEDFCLFVGGHFIPNTLHWLNGVYSLNNNISASNHVIELISHPDIPMY